MNIMPKCVAMQQKILICFD